MRAPQHQPAERPDEDVDPTWKVHLGTKGQPLPDLVLVADFYGSPETSRRWRDGTAVHLACGELLVVEVIGE